MEQKKSIATAAVVVAAVVILFIGLGYEKVSAQASDEDMSTAKKIMCYTTGLALVAQGVPLTAVITAGHVAHSEGVCP